MVKISPLSEHRCLLGEGPLWDPVAESLYWVDSLGPDLYRYDYHAGQVDNWRLPGRSIGSLALREAGGLVLAMDQGFYLFDPASAAVESIAEPLAGRDGLRFNDGKVDPFGDFVAGGMNIDPDDNENCPMYRLSAKHEVSRVLDGFHCFNGPCFSGDGEQFYVTGRRDGVIEVFDYGESRHPRNACDLIAGCNPDGATLDADGYIWSAQWDHACLLRISPAGEIDYRLPVCGQVVTSLAFGGPDLDLIYVTTLGQPYYEASPTGDGPGRTLVIEGSGYRGRPEPFFRG